MTSWQPLSARTGARPDPGPFEGVPQHLKIPLLGWFDKYVAVTQNGRPDEQRLEAVALRLQIESDRYGYAAALKSQINSDPVKFLDILDLGLRLIDLTSAARSLGQLLGLGASVWTVSDDGNCLVRRVSDTETVQYEAAVSAADEASQHLKNAWTAVYGLQPDPSSAWDDCIKACEAVLKPIVPNQLTMGGVVGTLRGQAAQYTLHLRDNGIRNHIDPMATFEQMLHFIWVNPDRHQGPDHRVPTPDEARAVLHLSITVVEWARTGILTKP